MQRGASLILSLRAENARLREAEAGMRERAADAARDAIAAMHGDWADSSGPLALADLAYTTIRALPLTGDDA